VRVSPDSLFDVQIKRLHEYKRQHLNLLHIVALYRRILQNPELDVTPRVFIFAAKAAPGYDLAKCIINAINSVGAPDQQRPARGRQAEGRFPAELPRLAGAADHPGVGFVRAVSTAGKEASGTGNMKLALNGSLTIGTLDGANVEILEEVGPDNIFIFGLTVQRGGRPVEARVQSDGLLPRRRGVAGLCGLDRLELLHAGRTGRRSLRCQHTFTHGGDPYLCLADFRSYCEAQNRVDEAYRDKARWAKMAILIRRGSASSPATARSTNTPAKSGICRRCRFDPVAAVYDRRSPAVILSSSKDQFRLGQGN